MNIKLNCGGVTTPLHNKLPIINFEPYKLCSKFEQCSAPICPLDSKNHLRVFRKDERICVWARELVKTNGEANLRGAIPPFLIEVIAEHTQTQRAGNTPYYKQLQKFSVTPSKLFKG